MTNLQAALQKIDQEFKAEFPNTNFATVLDRYKSEQITELLDSKLGEIIPEDSDASFFATLFQNLATYSPTLYSLAKAECVVSAVSYNNRFSINDGELQLDFGTIGINKPISSMYTLSTDYFSGESYKVTEKSTAAEWQAYLANSFAVCAKQFPIATTFDAEIEQFKSEIPGKILASLDIPVQTEL